MRPTQRLVAISVLALTLSGCSFEASIGSSDELNTQKLEDEIAKGIEEQTPVIVESVECPDDMKQEEGRNFECKATADDGSSRQVRVVQTDDDGNIDWELINP